MSEEDPGRDSFEERLRAIARELGHSFERAAERFDVDDVADQISAGGDYVRELAERAGRWLNGEPPGPSGQPGRDADEELGEQEARRVAGPHPRDIPTEEQGLALSALESGRWKVQPGTNEVTFDGEAPGPAPSELVDLVGELRARDWIAASGEVTIVGRDALQRWLRERKRRH